MAVKTRALATLFGSSLHVIVVNDGSRHRQVFTELEGELKDQVTVIHLDKNRGKGFALRQGIGASDASFTLFTDADFPYTLESMKAVYDALRMGSDVALGYREKDYYASVPWFRKGMSELFRFILKSILRSPITDTQCGLKGMGPKGREVFLQTRVDRFLVDLEFIKRAVRTKNVMVTPVVVKLRNDVVFSKMGIGVILREGWNFIRILFI